MRKGISGYTYMKHLIELWIGYFKEQLGNNNELVCDHNQPQQ